MIIHNLKELNKLGRDLEYEDRIYFSTKEEIIKYRVRPCHLECIQYNYNNNKIFKILGMDSKEKYKLASKYYGYEITESGYEWWPECKSHDFKATKRLIRELYKLLEEKEIIYDPEDRIKSRFEILDLRR